MPRGDDPTNRFSLDSDASADSGVPDWFMRRFRDQDAATLTDEPYGPVDITGGNNWIQPINGAAMEPRSCVPSRRTPGAWRMVNFTRYGYLDVIQGWKMHVGCHPHDFRAFFVPMSRYLIRNQIAHKFLPISSENMAFGSGAGHADGQGKSCVIYPKNPTHLRDIAIDVEALIRYENAGEALDCIRRGVAIRSKIRPYPGGVVGDLKIGRTGYIGVRYGAFAGRLATKKHPGGKGMLLNPFTKAEVPDPRNDVPYPDFANNVPNAIRALMW